MSIWICIPDDHAQKEIWAIQWAGRSSTATGSCTKLPIDSTFSVNWDLSHPV